MQVTVRLSEAGRQGDKPFLAQLRRRERALVIEAAWRLHTQKVMAGRRL